MKDDKIIASRPKGKVSVFPTILYIAFIVCKGRTDTATIIMYPTV